MKREYIGFFGSIVRSVRKHLSLTTYQNYSRVTKRRVEKLPHAEWIPEQLKAYAMDVNGHTIRWDSPEDGSGRPACTGDLNLLPIESIYNDWKGIVYFDFTKDERLKDFKVVDSFQDETCVGLYHDEAQDPGLYFFEFSGGNAPYPLHLDLKGYLTMLTFTLGYTYWQLAVMSLLPDDGQNPAYRRSLNFTTEFRRDMKAWVPDFSWDAFVALYEQLRLPS